jgi:glycerophosphoryl diester phosphodiesterase
MTLPLRPPVIAHHKAALDGSSYPPNSLEAIHVCLEARAPQIEIDVVALAADDYLLVHDTTLEEETTGEGGVAGCAVDRARELFIRYRGEATPYHVPLLSEVVSLFDQYPGETRLQIDFKDVLPVVEDEPLHRLIRLLESLGSRVQVSSAADWQLRRLRKLAAWLDIGFDPKFYLDYRSSASHEPPYIQGNYGYYDDHLLARWRTIPTSDYLAERCAILLQAVPFASVWYVRHHLLARALDDGFNMAAWLHAEGVKLDAWTLDADKPGIRDAALRLRDAGVDMFTSNTPLALNEIVTRDE